MNRSSYMNDLICFPPDLVLLLTKKALYFHIHKRMYTPSFAESDRTLVHRPAR